MLYSLVQCVCVCIALLVNSLRMAQAAYGGLFIAVNRWTCGVVHTLSGHGLLV